MRGLMADMAKWGVVFQADPSPGASGTPPATDPVDPPKTDDEVIKAAIAEATAKAVEEAVSGLKKKNAELIGKEKALKAELEAAKNKPSLTDDEYTEFKTLKERLEQDEMLKMLAEGKSAELIERVTKKTRLDAEAKLAAESEARTTAERKAADAQARYEQTLVNVEIAKATASGSVKPGYADLVSDIAAKRVKLVDGAVRVVNADGEVETTAGGKPLTVSEYIETMRGTLPDLFVASTGGGAGGSGRKPGGGNSTKLSMEMAESVSFEEYERLRKEGRIV